MTTTTTTQHRWHIEQVNSRWWLVDDTLNLAWPVTIWQVGSINKRLASYVPLPDRWAKQIVDLIDDDPVTFRKGGE